MENLTTDKAAPVAGKQPAVQSSTMKALVYYGPGKKAWEEQPKPVIKETTDAIVKILKTTICGTDLRRCLSGSQGCNPRVGKQRRIYFQEFSINRHTPGGF